MKKMTFNNIYEWPLMTRLLLLGLIFLATFYIGYRYDVSAQMSALASATQLEDDTKKELELVIRKNKMTEQEILRLPALKAELAKWNKQLIQYDELPQLLNQILKIGGENHLFFSSFTPGEKVSVPLSPWLVEAPGGEVSFYKPPQNNAAHPGATTTPATNANAAPAATSTEKKITYDKVPIKIVVIGGYHAIADFISQVTNLPWIVSVGQFVITSNPDESLLGAKVAKQASAQSLLTAEILLDVYTSPGDA